MGQQGVGKETDGTGYGDFVIFCREKNRFY